MNERLRQLMVQADYPAPEIALRAQKLAELIVLECVRNYRIKHGEYLRTGQYIDEYEHANNMLTQLGFKKHFGVEERKGWVCPKCGVDRTREACPKGHTAAITGDCPMTATAQSGVEE